MSEVNTDLEGSVENNGFEGELDGKAIVRIGKKPTMNYVVACMPLFNKGMPEIMVRAHGQSITKAVETVELLRRAFLTNVHIRSVGIGTESIKRADGSITSLSPIESTL